jgi:hypothetical protein
MEATLEGQEINLHIRSNKLQKKIITWPDSLADDYIHRSIDNELDQICFYDMMRRYKKRFNVFQKVHVNDEEKNSYIQGGIQKCRFKETHPGHKFSHLIQLKLLSIQNCIAEMKATVRLTSTGNPVARNR